jgi:DNA polymerase III subunit beta
MEFKAPKKDLQKVMTSVQGVVERSPARYILLNVRIIAQDDRIHIYASDGKVSLRDSCAGTVIRPGEITVHARNFFDMLKLLNDDEVHFSLEENNWASVTCGRSLYHLPGLPAEEFPEWTPPPEDSGTVRLPGQTLSVLLEKSHFAVSDDETRPVLCGVYAYNEDGEVGFVSTDGHRLAYARSQSLDLPEEFSLIIPRKVTRELRRLLGETDEDVDLTVTETNQFYQIGSTTLSSRNIAGTYPNFKQVVPQDLKLVVRFGREAMIRLLRRVMLIHSSQTQGMVIDVLEGHMRAKADNPEMGDVKDEFDVEYTGDPFTVCYNPRYLLEILQVMETEEVLLKLAEPMGPGILMEGEERDPLLLFILMPMKLK